MADASLSVALTQEASDSGDYIILEQKPWGKGVGVTSVLQGLQAIVAALLPEGAWPELNCGGDADGIYPILYIYPSKLNFDYKLRVSYGHLGGQEVDIVYRDETIQCNGADSVSIDYPPYGSVSLQWVGKCYDILGTEVVKPDVSDIGRKIFLSHKVYGTLRARYVVRRFKCDITIPVRPLAIENKTQCTAYAVWDKGLTWEEIEEPPGYDATTGDCGNGVEVEVDPDDPGPIVCEFPKSSYKFPKYVTANRVLKVNYCLQSAEDNEFEEDKEYEQRCHRYPPNYNID
jgi:hypothetical protein